MKRVLDRLFGREIIGHADCPLMLRWTVFYRLGIKITFHYFPPEADDKDPHDHPSPFVTFVLKGGYWNTEWIPIPGTTSVFPQKTWVGFGFHYRPAEHMHITETDHRGAWTFVVMGPKERAWGFLRLADHSWWPWEKYVERFGGTVRCDTDDGDRTDELVRHRTHRDYKGTQALPGPPDHSRPHRHE